MPASLHLIKLCVGAESIEDLREWIGGRLKTVGHHAHRTRMMPKRRDDLLDGGSLYWVIKGEVACRQAILDLRSMTDESGIACCDIVLDPAVIRVEPRPKGPFQGWRYLPAKDAPPDLKIAGDEAGLPLCLQRELRVIGLL